MAGQQDRRLILGRYLRLCRLPQGVNLLLCVDLGGDISEFVSPIVHEALMNRVNNR